MRWSRALIIVALALCALAACETGTKISSLEPAFGNVAGNDDVVIHGNGFTSGMNVQFGKKQVKNVVLDSTSRLRVKTPANAEGSVDIVITDDSGKTYVLKKGFRYHSEK